MSLLNKKEYEKERMNMRENMMKMAEIICIVILVILALLYRIFCFVSSGTIDQFTDEEGNILKNSIAEKTTVEINGAKNGFFIRGRSLDNPVILFVSSGPGTSDYFLNEEYPQMDLEDYFTVCYWEYRGMCTVYDKKIDPNTITTKQLLDDTLAVTEYLKERFHKEKIYIMGFSGGTHIALQAAALYPEQYYAYFAMSQVVTHGVENDTLIYDFMKDIFTKRKDQRRLNKLESGVIHFDDETVKCIDWPSFVYLLHEAGGGTIKDKSEFTGIIIPIMKAHCYTVKEKINYIRGMKMYRRTPFYQECEEKDYRNEITRLAIPVYFISGEYDYNTPWPLVQQYCDMIDAPEKAFFLVPDAAHSPLWENYKSLKNHLDSPL